MLNRFFYFTPLSLGSLPSAVFHASLIALCLAVSSCKLGPRGQASDDSKLYTPKDDGSQLLQPFRLNYAGYLPLQTKQILYVVDEKTKGTEALGWQLLDKSGSIVSQGLSTDFRSKDPASGDSFFIIDISATQKEGEGYRLKVGEHVSAPFAISADPYGGLKYEFFDYFRDHERRGDVFDRSVHNWTQHSVSFNFVADAGDQGYYPTNAATAQWSLINLLESFPDFNRYYHNARPEMKTVYEQLVFMSDPLDKVILPGQKLASVKFATFSNDSWAKCPGAKGDKGPCISTPETKATFAVARTLAAMSRLHNKFNKAQEAEANFALAQQIFSDAVAMPHVCTQPDNMGGEGGYYPDNDNWSLWRNPREHRDPCASGPTADPFNYNIADDHYAAMVEVYLSALELGKSKIAKTFKDKIVAHPHFADVNFFYFGAVSTEGTLSLLTHRPPGMDLSKAERNVLSYADRVLENQSRGYPGLTIDVHSNIWDSNDRDEVNNTFRWASNRMQLNDARILMAAANLSHEAKQHQKAADYTNAVLKVLDQISGTNAVALAMYTASGYSNIEYAVTRTHDRLVFDSEPGKMALGPNNWTNALDPSMPEFGSMPGMKMFTLKGNGWASREIAIDGNAALVPVVYFATEIAQQYLSAAASSAKDGL